MIEPACAVAAARADDVALRGLDRFRGFTEGEQTEFGYLEYDRSFHHAIADLSGTTRLAAVARDLTEQFERLRQVTQHTSDHAGIRGDCAEHEAIIDALQAHDDDRAYRLCHEHLEGERKRVATPLRRL